MSDQSQRRTPRKVSASDKDAKRPAGQRKSGPAVPVVPTAPGSAEMTAMVLRADRSIGLERRPVPTLRDNQVLVDIDLCGICGSDLHSPKTPEVYLGGFIMGHEPAGRIARVGRQVSGWRVGQRVAINPN